MIAQPHGMGKNERDGKKDEWEWMENGSVTSEMGC